MRLVVLGAAESGVGAALLAQKKGYDVFVSDMGCIKPCYKEMLNNYGIQWEEGRHTNSLILSADEVVKSPGIPTTAPIIKELVSQATPIISEIEFAARYTHARMICITGSNGKTTTTSLIYHILKKMGENVGLAGNIGYSLARQVMDDLYSTYVIELSSFQLDNMYKFRANIAVLLNITPDHLDRYDFKMQNYVDSKMRIIQNQQKEDVFIYWLQDKYIPYELPKQSHQGEKYGFADVKTDKAIAYVTNDKLVVEAPIHFEMPLSEISLSGSHNLRNCLAAAIATLSAGASPSIVQQGLSDFPGVEHRLEKVGTYGGINFINDSKATNVDACYYALESMNSPVVLILGGKDKGNDYTPISPLVQKKCRGLVFLGVDNSKLHAAFDSINIPIVDAHSMKECMEKAVLMARDGDTVLLSPCCASFDLFRNMEDRGEQFKKWISDYKNSK